jgi:C4-dicarboxylate-specific signal transduction histidine kinase
MTKAVVAPEKYTQYKSVMYFFLSLGAYIMGASYHRSRRNSEQLLTALTQKGVVNSRMSAMGDMAAGAVLEIQSPVSFIKSRLKIIREGSQTHPVDAEKIHKNISLIEQKMKRITNIVRNLAQFSQRTGSNKWNRFHLNSSFRVA